MKFNIEEKSVREIASKISLLLLDVDGVLTDGKLYFSNSGEEMKSFSTLDGHGIKMLLSHQIPVGIITGRTSNLVSKRAKDLGLPILAQGCKDKSKALDDILINYPTELAHIAYVGDDFPDLPIMRKVGLGISVPNGHPDVKKSAHIVTSRMGGDGAVREVTDFILKAQKLYSEMAEA